MLTSRSRKPAVGLLLFVFVAVLPAFAVTVQPAGGGNAASPIVVDSLITNLVAKLTAADAAVGDNFGASVSISGDTVVVGAYLEDDGVDGSGSAYVFERNTGGPDAWGQVAKLTAADAAYDDFFGISVSISGSTVVVGAVGDADAGFGSGSAYVFERNTGGSEAWGQVAKLTAADAAAGDYFGRSVSISGDTVVVGAWRDDENSGSAYLFERNTGGADAWGQVAKLTAPDAASGDKFGRSVSISGDTIVVGADDDDDDGNGSGSAYVFVRNTGGADAWGQVAKLTAADAAAGDAFGRSVSISDGTIVVGATSDADAGQHTGSAYVFVRNAGGPDAWGQIAKLTAADAASGEFFGRSVSIGGDTVVIGAGAYIAHGGGDEFGSAYVFERNTDGPDAWGQIAKLTGAGAPGDAFGRSVSIIGHTVIVGANFDDDGGTESGSAYIYTVGGCEWNQIAKPVAADPAPDDYFGISASSSGDTVVVGAAFDDDGAENSGSAYVFARNSGGPDGWAQIAKLNAADAGAGDVFGLSVSISGDTIVVGAARDDDGGANSGSAYVFERNTGGPDAWGQVAKLTAADAAATDRFGISVSISGDTVVVGAYNDSDAGDDSGSAYVFVRNAGGADAWGQIAKLTAADAAESDLFGWSVSIDGDTVVVGSYLDDDAATQSGSAYVFVRNAGGPDAWGQIAKLTAEDAAFSDRLGASVSISGNTVVVGANTDDAGFNSGSAYVFERNAGGPDAWGQVTKLTAPDAAGNEYFGSSVSISGDTVVVGVSEDDDVGMSSGSAYVFERNTGGSNAWGQVAKLTAEDATSGDRFGRSVSISGSTVVVGADVEDGGSYQSGSAYVFYFNCPICGDGLREVPEECDDGGDNSDVMPDACRTDCTLAGCGDGVLDSNEECDDGNLIDADGCQATCLLPVCGDRVADAGEECDDGNADNTDGCLDDCTAPVCGDGIVRSILSLASTANPGVLVSIDLSSGAGVAVAPQGAFGPVGEIELREDGLLLGATCGPALIEIDPATGAESLRCTLGNCYEALEFVNGTLYGNRTGDYYRIDDPVGGVCPEIFVGYSGFPTIPGLAYDPTSDTLYGCNEDDLLVCNRTTGACTSIGPIGFSRCGALEFAPDGTLYAGVSGSGPDSGKLLVIDPATGAGTEVGPTGFGGVSGLAFAGEQCDDGNNVDADGCAADCTSVCLDADGDGFGSPADPAACLSATEDCDDENTDINPDESEICDNGVDDNCDGLIDDADPAECVPLAVRLDTFTATAKRDGTVRVEWRTLFEMDVVAFRLVRTQGRRRVGAFELVNEQPIAAQGNDLVGAEYRVIDGGAAVGSNFYYLDSIDNYGRTERFGPVEVDVPARGSRNQGSR